MGRRGAISGWSNLCEYGTRLGKRLLSDSWTESTNYRRRKNETAIVQTRSDFADTVFSDDLNPSFKQCLMRPWLYVPCAHNCMYRRKLSPPCFPISMPLDSPLISAYKCYQACGSNEKNPSNLKIIRLFLEPVPIFSAPDAVVSSQSTKSRFILKNSIVGTYQKVFGVMQTSFPTFSRS